jgi:glucose-6-phosphate isomerase
MIIMLVFDQTNSLLENNSDKTNQILSQFQSYKTSLLSKDQGFIDLPQNHELVSQIKTFTSTLQDRFSHIVLLGIGGSSLGPKMLVDTLSENANIEVTILENIDPYEINKLSQRLPLSSTLFLVVTKSGGTPETMAQFLYFRERLNMAGLEPQKHMVFTTDPVDGILRSIATKENYQSFPVPTNVGGRFSVLSSVGLVIASLVGVDIYELLEGAGNVTSSIHQDEVSACLPYLYAQTQFELYNKGKIISVLMPYSTRLKTLGLWYSQLIAESIGKNPLVGITPVASLGTTDQHSLLQLFKEGPKDKLITFVEIADHQTTVEIPSNSYPELAYLNGHSFNNLIQAELNGTETSLKNTDISTVKLTLDSITPYSIGELIMFFELSTAFLGEFFEINAFNQPGVEESKILARENLKKMV